MPKICKNWTFHILFCWFICFQQTESYKRKKTESFWCFQVSNYIIASLFLLIFRRDVNIWFIAELAERSPIIIQNSSNLSSRKNLDVRPYDRTTVQGATFNMRGQLYRGHANATAFSSSPVVSALGSEADDPGASPSWGKALCP